MKRLSVLLLSFFLLSPAFAENKNTWNSPGTPPSPAELWKVPAGEPPRLSGAAPEPVSEEIQNKLDWTLGELIDFALKTAYSTKASWQDARAAEFEMKSRKGAFYPEVDLTADLSRIKGSAIGGQFTFKQDTFEPNATIRYVLFDFGRRSADLDESRKRLLAANFNHNAEVQNLILEVHRAYYGYIGSKALLQAQETNISSAKTALDAAQQRHDAGLATIADVLQARTQLSEAEFSAATTRGQIQILRGTLAVAIGIPPSDAKFEVVDELPKELPLDQISSEVMTMIQEGIKRRPDLAAAKAEALELEARARGFRAEQFPFIDANANLQRLYYLDLESQSNNYSALLSITFPLFDGFTRRNDYLQAKAEADAEKARVAEFQQQVGLQIWNSYYLPTTSAERIRSTLQLLKSAEESYDVASGRYREGVGNILDALAAQSALEDARAQDVRTRTEWLLSLAQLYHDMGTLGLNDQSFPLEQGVNRLQDENK